MSYAKRRFGFGAALMMSSALAINPVHPPASTYEARLSGAMALELRGTNAEFGVAPGSPGPFVITIGAASERGAVVFTRWDGRPPAPGAYAITAEPTPGGIQALIVTGPPTRPTGVFRAKGGSLVVTRSNWRGLSAHFQLQALGFTTDAPEREDREASVRGTFTATPSR